MNAKYQCREIVSHLSGIYERYRQSREIVTHL